MLLLLYGVRIYKLDIYFMLYTYDYVEGMIIKIFGIRSTNARAR